MLIDDPDHVRAEAPGVAGELAMLAGWLDWHRGTLELRCAGLAPAHLAARSAAPSTLSLLGLVRHLTEVERTWFLRKIAKEDAPPLYYSAEHPDGEFDLVDPATVDDADVERAFAAWRAQCGRSRAITASLTSLDDVHEDWGRTLSTRWILVHMIEEYARHNGHADLLRERIDGVTGE